MRRATARRSRARLLAGVSGAGALLLASALVWQSSYAGFTDATTPLPLPSVTTGTVVLTDDDAEKTMFTVSGLRPGASGEQCITVTSRSSVPTGVRMYVTGRDTTRSLSSHLVLTVDSGTRRNSNGCSIMSPSLVYAGTLAAMPTTYAQGVGNWSTQGLTAGESRTYRVVYTLDPETPASAQGGSARTTFVWEAQTT